MSDATPLQPRRLSLLSRVAGLPGWTVVIGVGSWMAFSYSLPQRLDDTSSVYARAAAVAFFGRVLTFHVGLLLMACTFVGWLLRRKRLMSVSAIGAVIGVAPTLWHCRPKSPGPVRKSFRLMDMNLKYYQADSPDILTQVRRFGPDIIAVEDPTPTSHRVMTNGLKPGYPHRCVVAPESGQGLEIYSRFPFLDQPQWVADNVQRLVRVTVSIHGTPTALWVVHPFSPRSLVRIVRNRVATQELARAVGAEVMPVIMAGDFNFTEETPNQRALEDAGLRDGFDTGGFGRGSTWPARPTWAQWLPGVRIDHVFVSKSLTCVRLEVGTYDGSDHLPIVADLGFKSP